MKFFDADKDGSVTQSEFSASSSNRFNIMDGDANNVISVDEFKTYVKNRREEHRQSRFADIDGDNDGQLSQNEFLEFKRNRAEHRFLSLDKNSDGLLSTTEFVQSRSKHHRGGYKHRRKGHRMFKKLDQNGDGKITRDESRAAWSNWFKRIDANGNMVVTIPEVQEYRKKKWEMK